MNYSELNIIAVDDELNALQLLEDAIRQAMPDCMLHSFTAPSKALEHAKKNRVDVAFLDIKMPGMNGLAFAVNLKKIYGKTNIVFTTGYSEYALDSYKIDTSDYLMKPIEKEHVLSAMKRLRNPVERKLRSRVFAQTFGNFDLFLDGKPIAFTRRTKAKEVLAYLIDRQGTSATTAEITAAIWENNEYTPKDQDHIQQIIRYMKQVLREHGIEDIIIRKRNAMSIDKTKISCDYYDLLAWDINAVNAFDGKYMSGYTWAEMTLGALCQKTKIF